MNTRKSLFMLLALAMFGVQIQADVLRVNNITGAGAAYTTLQDAHDAASNGDTLAIDASLTYGNIVVTKQLVIIGPGYFLGENSDTQANISPAGVDVITFNSGSEGSLVTGLWIKERIFVNVSNIVIQKNLLKTNYSAYLIQIDTGLNNTIIKQNYIYNESSYNWGIDIGTHSQAIISNNFIGHDRGSSYAALKARSSSVVTIENNIIGGQIEMNNASVSIKNNILLAGTVSGISGGISNNIANDGQFGSDDGNQTATMTDVFKYSGSTDGQWQLKTGSPAIGAGVDGIDCGMFGGLAPYELSGIPGPMPVIYYLHSSGQGTESAGLQIHLKSKVNN